MLIFDFSANGIFAGWNWLVEGDGFEDVTFEGVTLGEFFQTAHL
jgi:hypothetical protein